MKSDVGPKVAIVVGQGGVKPSVAFSLFKLLQKEGLPYHTIVGCSGGAMVGGLEASGFSDEMKLEALNTVANTKYLSKANAKQLLGLMNIPFFNYEKTEGVLNTEQLKSDLYRIYGDLTFDDMKYQLAVAGTDFHTGEGVHIHEGYIRDALYASSCIYPFMQPTKIGNKLVVDGALSDPIPFDIAMEYHPDLIIVISVIFYPDHCPEGLLSAFDNFFSQAVERKGILLLKSYMKKYPGKVVHIDIQLDEQISLMETDRMDFLLEVGRKASEKARDEILMRYDELLKIRN